MTRLLEGLSLATVKMHGVHVPRSAEITSAVEAANFTAVIGTGTVLKALVPAGGRQKGGFVHFADTPEDARSAAEAMLGKEFKHFPVNALLVSERLAVAREFFLSITFDSSSRAPLILFSGEGGVDIEQIAKERPEVVVRRTVDIALGLRPFEAREIASSAGLKGRTLTGVTEAILGTYRAFRATDAQLVEINPLAELDDGRIMAASAVVTVDNQAKFRQRELLANDNQTPNNGWRPYTELELRMQAIDELDPTVGNIRFNELIGGDIALMVTGGGGGLTALDAMTRAGGKPATTFDIKIGNIEEKVYLATKAVLERPGLKGMVIGANFSNFTGIDIKVRGAVRAIKDAGVDLRAFPIVMRLCGPNQEEANRLASEIPGLEFMDERYTIEDAVECVVRRAYRREAVER